MARLSVTLLALPHQLLILVERLVKVLLLFVRVARKYVRKVEIFFDQRLCLKEHYVLCGGAPQLFEKVDDEPEGISVLLDVIRLLHFSTDLSERGSELIVFDFWQHLF